MCPVPRSSARSAGRRSSLVPTPCAGTSWTTTSANSALVTPAVYGPGGHIARDTPNLSPANSQRDVRGGVQPGQRRDQRLVRSSGRCRSCADSSAPTAETGGPRHISPQTKAVRSCRRVAPRPENESGGSRRADRGGGRDTDETPPTSRRVDCSTDSVITPQIARGGTTRSATGGFRCHRSGECSRSSSRTSVAHRGGLSLATTLGYGGAACMRFVARATGHDGTTPATSSRARPSCVRAASPTTLRRNSPGVRG